MKAYYEIIERLNDEERNALAKELDRILEHQKTARAVVDNRRNLDANYARALFGALQDTV